MAQSDYNVNINIRTNHENPEAPKKAKKGLEGLKQAAKALGVVMAAGVAVKYAAELVKVGAAAERQASSLENLAAAQGESGTAIIKAIQGASDFTIDRMAAMQAANRAMVMDVAKSPEEFERLTKVAVALGRAMGQDAAKSIDDFVTAGARSSVQIADNLGLVVTVEAATTRYAASLGKAVEELTDAERKQAFLNEMLVQGEAKMAQLGDQTLDSAGKIEQVETAWTDARLAISEAAAAVAHTTGILDKVSTGARRWSADVSIFADAMKRLREGASLKEALFDVEPSDIAVIDSATQSYTAMAQAEVQAAARTREWSRASDDLKSTLSDQVVSQGMMEHTILATAEAIRREGIPSQNELEGTILGAAAAIESETVAMDKFASTVDAAAQLSLSIGFTRQAESEKESAARIAADKEKIESKHLENMAAIQAKGQSRAIKFDLEAETKKLANLKFAMDQALLKSEENSGKEAQSTLNAEAKRLSDSQTSYAEQQSRLDDFHAGKLVTAGINTDALIAEEQRRYEETLRIQALEEEKIAKDQKKAQGQMLLSAVDTWADQEDLPDGYAKEVAKMRVNIAEEYGMVAEGSAELVTDILGELDAWAGGAKVTTGELVGYFGDVISATDATQLRLLDLTASEYVIKVRWEQQMLPEGVVIDDPAVPKVGCTEAQKRDPNSPCYEGEDAFTGASSFRVRGTNLDTISPPLGGNGGTVNNNSDTFIINDPRAMVAVQENRRRQLRGGIARTM